jgi:serine/threonine protein phosphatase 1
MIAALRQMFRAPVARAEPAVPPGQRIYAVGDIHGRSDLFDHLIEAIEADDAARSGALTTVVLLGDLVDRGPDSAGVIAAARAWQQRREVRIITGNHEEMFLQSFEQPEVLRHFLRYGGRETILSYPVDPVAYAHATLGETQALMREAIPPEDLEFIRGFEDFIVVGDYLFVHAGIAPGVPVEQQQRHNLRWIRDPFLSHRGDHGQVVVHGHTICGEPEVLANRIGIDTGAYASGRLTALGLEGTERWLIEANDTQGEISHTVRSA